jgi:hypothetical protein
VRWSDIFILLERYGLGRYYIYAEHDVIYIDLPRQAFNDADWAALEEFGFIENTEMGFVEIYV